MQQHTVASREFLIKRWPVIIFDLDLNKVIRHYMNHKKLGKYIFHIIDMFLSCKYKILSKYFAIQISDERKQSNTFPKDLMCLFQVPRTWATLCLKYSLVYALYKAAPCFSLGCTICFRRILLDQRPAERHEFLGGWDFPRTFLLRFSFPAPAFSCCWCTQDKHTPILKTK